MHQFLEWNTYVEITVTSKMASEDTGFEITLDDTIIDLTTPAAKTKVSGVVGVDREELLEAFQERNAFVQA